MARFLAISIVTVALLVAHVAPAAIKGKCNLECSAANNRVKLQPGQVYQYKVESSAGVLLAGVDAIERRVRFEAEASVFAIDKCNFAVTVSKITLHGADDKKFSPAELLTNLAKPVKFALGSADICTQEDDATFSVNIKRAIASAFVNGGDDGSVTDHDIFGTCHSVVSVSQQGGVTIINRARNLNLCSGRETLGHTLSGSVFNEASGIKSTPTLNGDYSSEVRLKGGVVDSATVDEEYRFVAFSTASAGARAKVQTKLRLSGNSKGAPKNVEAATVQRGIAFETPREGGAATSQRLRDVIREAVDSFADGVGANATSQFVDIVRLLRDTGKNDIKTTFQTIVSKSLHERSDLARKIYLDALFRTATGDSVEAIIDLLNGRAFTPQEQRLAMLSMNLVTSLDRDSINSFQKLTPNTPNVLPEALLATGTLVRKYCDQYTCTDEQLDKVLDRFTGHLHQCQPRKKKEEDVIVTALKGIRNTHGYIGRKLVDNVIACTQKNTKSRIRVAAIEALEGVSCEKRVYDNLVQLLDDVAQDPELRLQAYLALTKCPTPQLADHLQKLLDGEEIQQVGAFITSHLASLRATTDPARQTAREVLGRVRTAKRFPFDLRRYSHSRELSYAVDSLGLGASVDSNIIYSHSSFLPRSATVNVTGELFGNAFNVLDLSVRQGNLDSVIERYLGPKGILSSKSPQQLYDFLKKTVEDAHKRTEGLLRGRRDVSKADLNAFAKNVILPNDVTSSDLDLDVSVKFLGNELVFLSLGDDLPTTPDDVAAQLSKIVKEFLDGATKFQRNFEAHALFVDGELSYPTAGGLPLRLTAHATGVVGLETSGAIDIRRLWRDPSQSPVQLKVVPSANLELVGALLVDAYAVTSGIQVSGSVHTSTGADVKVSFQEKPCKVDVKISMPRKKQEIFSINHDIVLYTRERGQQSVSVPLRFSSKRTAFNGCFDQLHRYTGVTFCTDYNVTIPGNTGVAPFPLNGANRIAVWLEVDSSYHFAFSHSHKDESLQYIRFTFDTPDSSDPRTTTLAFESATSPNIFVRAELDSPYRKVMGEAGLANNEKEVALYAKAKDQGNEYIAKIGFTKDEAKREYSPILVVKTPASRDNTALGYSVEGKIKVNDGGGQMRYDLQDIRLKGGYFTSNPLTVSGTVTQRGTAFDTDLKIDHRGDTGTVKGSLQFEANRLNLDLKVKCGWHANVQYKVSYQTNEILNHLELEYGYGSGGSHHIKALQQWRHKYSKYRLEELLFNNELELSHLPLKARLNGNFVDGSVIKYDVGLEYGGKEASSKLDVKLNEKTKGDYAVEADASINKKKLSVIAKRIVQENASKYSNRLFTSTGLSLEANGVIGHRISAQEADIVADAKAQFGEKQQPYVAKFELKLKPQGGNTHGSLSAGKNDLVTFKGTLNRKGNTQDGNFQVTVKEILEGSGDFTATGGNGTATVNLNVLKLSKEIKVVTNFAIEAPIYNVATEVFYDTANGGGRRTLRVDTRNLVESQSFRSNNEVEVFTERYVCNVEGALDGKAGDGVLTGQFEVTLPTGRKLSGSIKREVRPQGDGIRGSNEVAVSDKLPNNQVRSLSLLSQLLNAKWSEKIFQAKHTVVYKDLDGKDVTVKLDLHHKAAKENTRAIDGDLSVAGSLFARSIKVTLRVPEYSQDHADFNVAVKSEKDGDVQLVGRYVIGGRAKANEYDVTFSGSSKGDKARTIEVKSSGSFLSPQVDHGVYDTKWKLSVKTDGKESHVNVAGVANEDHANVKVDLKLHERDPVSVALTYNHEETPDGQSGKCNLEAEVNYAKDKKIHGKAVLKRTEGREIDLHATLETPYEKASNVVFNVKGAKTNEGVVRSAVDVTVNKDTYGLNSAVVLSDANPSVDLVVIYPKKEVKFFAGFARVGEKKYNGKVKIENLLDYNVDATGEIAAASIENFAAKVDIDAPKLKLDKFHGELKSKHQGASKGVEVQASNGGKSILTGFADYTVEQNKTLTVFEAKGNVKFYEKESEAHLKFIHHTLTQAENQETGVSFIVNAHLGPKSIVGELKITDKNVQLKHAACEKQQQCIHLDIQSTISQADLDSFKHQIVVSIDLRKLGYSHEFGLKAETSRKGVELDHTIEMHLQAQDKPQYQYSMYIHSKSAGVVVTLPERTIALEGVFERPETLFGKWDVSGALYLDKKNKPHESVRVGLKAHTKEPKKGSGSFESALTFAHPAIRTLSVTAAGAIDATAHEANVKLNFDVFKTAAKEVVVVGRIANTEKGRAFNVSASVDVTSKHGLDYRASGHAALAPERRAASFQGDAKFAGVQGSALFSITPADLYARITALEEDLFVADAKIGDKSIAGQATIRPFKSTPITMSGSAKGLTEAKVHLSRANLVTVDGEFAINRAASFKINSQKGDIFTAQVTLDQQHFLASKYQMNSDQMRQFLQEVQTTVKQDLENTKKHIETKVSETRTHIAQQYGNIQKEIPEFDAVAKNIKEELSKILQELEKDPSIKPIIDAAAKICGVVAKTFADLFEVTVQSLKKVSEIITSFYGNLVEIFNARILPSLVEWYAAVEKILHTVYLDTVSLLSGTIERVAKALKDYEEDFNKVAKVSSETIGRFVRGATELLTAVQKEIADLQRLVQDYVASLPGIDLLKEKYNALFVEYNIPEHVINLMREFNTVIRDAVPSQEIRDFIESIVSYIEAKLGKKDVNDLEHLKQIYSKGVVATKAVIQLVKSQPTDVTGSLNVAPGGIPLPFSLDILRRVPYISSIRLSPVNYLRNERFLTPRDLLTSLTPNGRLTLNLLPPFPLAGHVIDGQHIFTFDGRHFTFPGDCSYILARDFLHGNFSVVATLQKGKMSSVSLFDGPNVATVDVGGAVKVNDKAVDLPVHSGDFHIWRRYYTVTLLSLSGAEVMCTTDLITCHVKVSGFYRGRLRGILGNGNGEPFDDFQLPEGKLAGNYAEFGNAYGVTPSCPAVGASHHPHAHGAPLTEPCASLFSSDPALRLAFLVNDPTNYREACQHAVGDAPAAKKTEVACNIVSAYVSAARLDGIPVSVPQKCLTCSENRNIGSTFSVKAPQKQADVVFVVDTSQPLLLTEFTHQVATELRKELRAFDMGDVNVAVIGFEKHHRYPSHFTHNGKLDVHGKLTPRDEGVPRCDLHLKTGFERVDDFLEQWANTTENLAADLGLSADARAFQEAMAYPFRAKATKIIFAVRSDSLAHSSNPSKSIMSALANSQVKKQGIQVHLLSPVEEFSISGKDAKGAKANDIVGFSSRTVIQMADAKKRVNPGQQAWRKAIKYQEDLGMELVQDAGGFTFILQNYLAGNPKAKKQFTTAVVNAVADHAARHETHLDCECQVKYGLHAEEKCSVVEVKLLKQVQRLQRG